MALPLAPASPLMNDPGMPESPTRRRFTVAYKRKILAAAAACTTPTEASRRWAALLQQIFEVDSLACPTCRGPMRIIACITQASVIDQILAHLRSRAAHAAHAAHAAARSPPSTRGPSGPGLTRRPAAAHQAR